MSWRVARAILALPFVATVVIPAVILLPLVEEPVLVRRFGADYERYMNDVGRWLPRRRR